MESKQVIQTCLDFSLAHGGTIQPMLNDSLAVQSRTTRTEILIERDPTRPGVWQAEQRQNAAGECVNPKREILSTEEHLLLCLQRFWGGELDPARVCDVLEPTPCVE